MKDDRPDDRAPDEVTRTLRGLTREKASPSFTDGVLARIAAGERPQTRSTRAALPALLGAAAAAVGTLVLAYKGTEPPPAPARPVPAEPAPPPAEGDLRALGAELEQLRREQRDLAAEVESLRARDSDRSVPVIYVGQSAGVDLVFDLAHFEQRVRPRGAGGKR